MAYDYNKPLLANLINSFQDYGAPKYTPNGTYITDGSDVTSAAKLLEISEKAKAEMAKRQMEKETALIKAGSYGVSPDATNNKSGVLEDQLLAIDPQESIYNYSKNNFMTDLVRARAMTAGRDDPAEYPNVPEPETSTQPVVDATAQTPVSTATPNTKTSAPAFSYSPFGGMSTTNLKAFGERSAEINARNDAEYWVNNYVEDNGRLFTKTSKGELRPVYDPYNQKINNYYKSKQYLDDHPIEETALTANDPAKNTSTKSGSKTKDEETQLTLANPNHYSNKVNPNANTWGTRQDTVESRLQEAFNTGSDYDLSAEEKAKVNANVDPATANANSIETSIIGTDPLDKGQRWETAQEMRDYLAKNQAFSTNTLTKFGNDLEAKTNDTLDSLSKRVGNLGSIKDTVYALSNGNASANDVIANYWPKVDPLDDKALGISSLIEEGKRKHPDLTYAVIGTALKKYLTNATLSKLTDNKISADELNAMKGKFNDALKILDSDEEGNINDIKDNTYATIQKIQDLKSLRVAYDTATASINQAISTEINFNKGDAEMSEFAQEILNANKVKAFNDSQALYNAALPIFSAIDAYNGSSKKNNNSSEKK